jgi:phospholipid/cholesterol/gamma-HCH transport system ATP-binding protein
MTAEPLISFRNVHKTLGHQHVLRGVTLDAFPSETLVIIGRSGCGKSVLLKNLVGLMNPEAGSILVEGEEVVGMSERQLANIRRKIAIVFQGGALFDSLSVEENVAFPLLEERCHTSEAIRARVGEVLDAVGLSNQQRKMPSELSGGMRKRVALARALSRRPEVILYDEPTTGLDPVTTDSINKLIVRMRERYGVTSIVVTHDMKTVFSVADRIAMLHAGKVYAVNDPEELRKTNDPVLRSFIDGISGDADVLI